MMMETELALLSQDQAELNAKTRRPPSFKGFFSDLESRSAKSHA
jgi:hypothetical protein